MLRDTEEELVWQLGPVVEHRDTAPRVERAHPMGGDELDAPLDEGVDQRA